MNQDEIREVIALTIKDERTLGCPLCPHTVDAPPVPVSDQLGAVFGMSGDTLARVHAEQTAKRTAHAMRAHINSHSGMEWLRVWRAAR